MNMKTCRPECSSNNPSPRYGCNCRPAVSADATDRYVLRTRNGDPYSLRTRNGGPIAFYADAATALRQRDLQRAHGVACYVFDSHARVEVLCACPVCL